ncbi:hypothetical protein EW145_g6870 [Phellinidium pouzarii]|uniref:Lysosomal dipeptide transporter MFSD1 n=1 Tax=Phellinidium pouzarii TaxID=167371 RepID=A0A4S4KSS4_9AGAM|nr:hypothetical protein EW145_g6870 [Phellinidium pouzarii]
MDTDADAAHVRVNVDKRKSPSPSIRDENEKTSLEKISSAVSTSVVGSGSHRPRLPIGWRILILVLTCLCSWTHRVSEDDNHKRNEYQQFAVRNPGRYYHVLILRRSVSQVNTFLCIGLGLSIDKWGGPLFSVILAAFHLSGAIVMAGGATNNLNSYPLLIVGKVIAAIGDGSLDNAQHRIFSTYFARGGGFAFSIGAIWGVANLAQFTGQSTANVIATNLGTYAWALWVSAIISLFSLLCALSVLFLDKWLCKSYQVTDQTDGHTLTHHTRRGVFSIKAIRHLPLTFWLVVLFAIFENAGVQSFVSISTQFAQQRLKKGAVIGGWVSSFYLLLPACLTPFLGIIIDVYGQRVTFLFVSGLTFMISMLLLKLSHTVPSFVAAYIFYAISQCVTPAPQVEIVRSVIADPQWFATAFAIKSKPALDDFILSRKACSTNTITIT